MQHSHQESLETSSIGLIRQGRPGFTVEDGEAICKYAKGCAVAQLLPPEVDRAEIDALDPCMGSLSACGPVMGPILHKAGHDPIFAYHLQRIHDASVRVVFDAAPTPESLIRWRGEWMRRLRRFAKDHGLDLSKVEQATREAGWEVA